MKNIVIGSGPAGRLGSLELGKLGKEDIIVIPAGKARDPNDKNSTREALFSFNKKIVNNIGKTLKEEVFKDDEQPLIIVLTNPVDSILKSFIETNNLDPKKTIGSGNQLDTFRFIQNLADKLHVNEHDIENAFVVGQHGKNMVYCFDQTKICGESISNYMKNNNISEEDIEDVCSSTTNEGGKIIAAAGATCFGPASSVIAIIDSFIENKNEIFSLSVMHEDGNCFGYPVYVNNHGVEVVKNFNLTDKEKEELNNSINCINELDNLSTNI